VQQLIWNRGNGSEVTAHLWGGGGGGGGNDSNPGGNGGGAGYASRTFTVNNGDVIEIAVGGNGTAGATGGSAPGGAAGASYISDVIFNSRTGVPNNPAIVVSPTSYSGWLPWMNEYAVTTNSTDISYTINFPSSQNYNFSIAADYGMSVYLDGNIISSSTDYAGSYAGPSPASVTSVFVTSGSHTIRVVWNNDGGTAGWALTVNSAGTLLTGSLANAPPPVAAIAPGTSGYYVYSERLPDNDGQQGLVIILTYTVVVNGAIIYQDSAPPPTSVGSPGAFVGRSYDEQGVFPDQNRYLVDVYNLYIPGNAGFSGGRGGNAGGAGSSGSGGGSGGATVLLLNGSPVAVAGGGGGGGGGGNRGAAAGQSAPGTSGQSTSSSSGQNGQDKNGDGGGGGAGGGGVQGGNGGATPGGDQGGLAGVYGTSNGTTTANPSGRTPGGADTTYYTGTVGQGGVNTLPGTAGYAVFVFNLPGVYVNQAGTYSPVTKVWIKNNGTWTQPQTIYVNNGGTWQQVLGSEPPTFTSIPGNFGVLSRPWEY